LSGHVGHLTRAPAEQRQVFLRAVEDAADANATPVTWA
jgi:hypothetical protein